MIQQPYGPKTPLLVRLTNENYDYLYRIAGEQSLALALNCLIEERRKRDIGFCNSSVTSITLKENSNVR